MNLVKVERTSGRMIDKTPRLSISKKGTMYFNSKSMVLLNVPEEGTRVFFFQDKEDSQKWYININEEGYARLKPKDLKKDGSGQIHISDISEKIISSFYHVGDKSLKFIVKDPLEHNDEKYFPIEIVKESLEMEIPDPNGRP